MNIVRTIRLDLAKQDSPMQLGFLAVAGDSPCRSLEFELFADGKPWQVPEDVSAYVAFRTIGGFIGQYDTLPDGNQALRTEGNRVTVQLIDQMVAKAGKVWMYLVLQDACLNRVSSFYLNYEVETGFETGTQLPERYYNVSTLGELNSMLEDLTRRLEAVDTEQIRKAAEEARTAAEQAVAAAGSVDAQALNDRIDGKGDDIWVEDGKLYLLSDGEIIGTGAELPQGLSFDSGFVDASGYLHLTMDGADIAGFAPFFVGSGGSGGSSSVMKLTTSLASREFSILDRDTVCEIPFSWSSLMDGEPTGSGFAEWTVGGSRVALVAVEQGDCTFDIRPYLAAGAKNTVVLKVTDIYGTFRSLSLEVTVTSYGLSWNLGETGIYGSMGFSLRLTPTGTGDKTIKVSVDGEVISETAVSTTGRTVTVTVPVQSHGAHTIKAWVEAVVDGEALATEPLKHVGAWMRTGITTPVVALLDPEVTVGQYGTAAIRWFVVDPAAETTTVSLQVDGETVSVLQNVDRSVQTWHYKAGRTGEFTLRLVCGSGSGTARLTVTGLGYDIQPVTAGLELDLDPAGHSNSEAGRESFGYTDGDGINHPLTFSDNFDWVGGGFQTDSVGVTAFVVKRGTTVTLDRGLFDTDCRTTGRNLKLIFKSDNVRNYDAQLMSCKSGNVGIVVQAQKAAVTSQLETMTVPYCEGRKIEMDLCIDSENEDSLAWINLKAIQSCPPIKYGASDSWAQSNPVPLVIGSEDADVWIYRMKLYGNSLNRYEVLDNHIADCGDPDEMVARYERCDIYNDDGSIGLSKLSKANPKLRVIHIRAPRMTTGKEDEVTADFEMTYGEGGEAHHLIAQGITFKAQGTSSLEYILAALNLDVDFGTASSFVNGLGEAVTEYAMTDASVPVSYFNLKANVASSESANNVCLANEYNTWNPYVCAPRAADSRVRDTVEGHPCAVFFTSTADTAIEVGARTVQPGETILYFVGDMNNSKKNVEVFGQDNGKYPKQCCVEVMNNTELPCRFKEEIGDDEPWKDGNFEFRFPKNPTDEMKAAFTAMQRWVVSTDREAATGNAFQVPITYAGVAYAGDTAQYRAAKFLAEFADYFVPEAMDFHYLFTDENCMTDNRAKNLFFCYEYIQELDDYRWSVRCDYDNDTGLGNDNSGGLTFGYGLEDTDMVGDSWVFNAHDSVLWCNIRDLRSAELATLHAQLAGKGAWDPDRRSRLFREYQGAVCEALRAEDMHNKYFLPWLLKDAAAYARKCCGTKEEQRDQFLYYQEPYKGSQYVDVSNRSDAVSMRVTVEKAENGDLVITTYSDMYIVVMYGNGGTVKQRVKRNTPTTIHCPTDSLGDTETYIFFSSNLTAISSLAGLKPKFVLATTAKRLQELIIGSGEVGYQNLNLNQIGVGSNQMLRVLNLQGCPNLVTALELSGLTSLERFLANGSGITGVSFARGCPLTEIRLPAVSSLTALELKAVQTFLMDGSNLTLLRLENCEGIDSLSICKSAPNLERGRLTNVDWTDSDAMVLERLAGLAGYDAQGKPVDAFVLTGRAHVGKITQLQIDAVTAAFPELELSYDEIVPVVTVSFCSDEGTVLKLKDGTDAVFTIPSGGTLENPITAGWMDAPAKQSDMEYHYSFTGWDKSLTGITLDTRVTAVFFASDRYYRVTHWLDGAQSVKLQEDMVIAHGAVSYSGANPVNGEAMWMGWDAAADDVVSDMDIHAVFITPRLPDSKPQEYDFLYSDDPDDNSAFTLAEFAGILEQGQGKVYFQLGDRVRMIVPKNDVFTDTEFILRVCGFNHYRLSDGSAMAGVVFEMVGVMNGEMYLNRNDGVNYMGGNTGGWPAMYGRDYLNEQVFPVLPLLWRNLIRKVQVRSSAGNTSAEIVTSKDWLFLLSAAEVTSEKAVTPYTQEVDPEAENVTFEVYTDHTSRKKYRYNGTGSQCHWYLRSPDASNNTNIHYIAGGTWAEFNSIHANGTFGCTLSFACCMGGACV